MKWSPLRSVPFVLMVLGYGASVAVAVVTHDMRLVNAILAFVWTFGVLMAGTLYYRLTKAGKDKFNPDHATGLALIIGLVFTTLSLVHVSWAEMPPWWLAERIPFSAIVALAFLWCIPFVLARGRTASPIP